MNSKDNASELFQLINIKNNSVLLNKFNVDELIFTGVLIQKGYLKANVLNIMQRISDARKGQSIKENQFINLMALLFEGNNDEASFIFIDYFKQVEQKLASVQRGSKSSKRYVWKQSQSQQYLAKEGQILKIQYSNCKIQAEMLKMGKQSFIQNFSRQNLNLQRHRSNNIELQAKLLHQYKEQQKRKKFMQSSGIKNLEKGLKFCDKENEQNDDQILEFSEFQNNRDLINYQKIRQNQELLSSNIQNYRKMNEQKYKMKRSSVVKKDSVQIFSQDDDLPRRNKFGGNQIRKSSSQQDDLDEIRNFKDDGISSSINRHPKQLQIDDQPSFKRNQGRGGFQERPNYFRPDEGDLQYPYKHQPYVNDEQRIQDSIQISGSNLVQSEEDKRHLDFNSIPLDPEFQVPSYSFANNAPKHPKQEQKKHQGQLYKQYMAQQQRYQQELKRQRDQQMQASLAFIKQLEQQQQNKKVQQMKRQVAEQEESIKLAKLLQFEQLKKRQEEQKKIQQDVVCKICLMQIEFRQYDPFQNCGHLFHRQCIGSYLKNEIEIRKFPIKCPLSDCGLDIADWDIRSRIDEQYRQKYKNYTFDFFIQRNPDVVSCCPTPDCQNVFAFREGIIHFNCDMCNKDYCLNCKCNWHDGMTCQQYKINENFSQDDKKFIKFVKGKNFKQCRKCKFWVERSGGCDHMTCKCGAEFCYQCGGPYRRCKCRGFDFGDDD